MLQTIFTSSEDYCIGCGAYVAEGRQVCPECMNKAILKSNQKKEEERNKPFVHLISHYRVQR